MCKIKLIFIFSLFIFCLSCSKKVVEETLIKEKDIELQMIAAYEEGLKELKKVVFFSFVKFSFFNKNI